LLDRFDDKIDQGSIYYHLAQAYEEAGLYPLAFKAYQRFLDFPDTIIPGRLDEHQRVREMLALAGVNRDWTRENLNQLINEIRTALSVKDINKILALQAKVNFFSMSWLQEKADFNSQMAYDLRRFVQSAPHIYSENTLEGNSNSQEAFLKTRGWSPYMDIWYLYFRRVNFPADPEINGNWEWVGIYFGNSIQ
jgi:tetratricopeptide (TPR) repeat protein